MDANKLLPVDIYRQPEKETTILVFTGEQVGATPWSRDGNAETGALRPGPCLRSGLRVGGGVGGPATLPPTQTHTSGEARQHSTKHTHKINIRCKIC